MTGSSESLAAKARRIQSVLELLRGHGDVDGVRVEVDATNRLTDIRIGPTAPADRLHLADTIRHAYRAAVDDVAPQRSAVQRELADDPRARRLEQRISQHTVTGPGPGPGQHPEPDEGSWFDERGGSIFGRA